MVPINASKDTKATKTTKISKDATKTTKESKKLNMAQEKPKRVFCDIEANAHHIRVLNFSYPVHPVFKDKLPVCNELVATLQSTFEDYAVIVYTPPPKQEPEIECLYLEDAPVTLPRGLAGVIRTIFQERLYMHFAFPIRLWIEPACVNQDSTSEKALADKMMPEIFNKADSVIIELGRGESKVSKYYLDATRHLLGRLYRPKSNIERNSDKCVDLDSFMSMLPRAKPGGTRFSWTLGEYANLALDFFKLPFWNWTQAFVQFVSVKSMMFLHDGEVFDDCLLTDVATTILKHMDMALSMDSRRAWTFEAVEDRDIILPAARHWRMLVRWELARRTMKSFTAGQEKHIMWQELLQLGPVFAGTARQPHDGTPALEAVVDLLRQYHETTPEPKLYKPLHTTGPPAKYAALVEDFLTLINAFAEVDWVTESMPDVRKEKLASASHTNLSQSPYFFFAHAGTGLYPAEHQQDAPSWVPNYEAMARAPVARLPLTLEDPATYDRPSFSRYCPEIRGATLVARGIEVERLAEVWDIPAPEDTGKLFSFLEDMTQEELGSRATRTRVRETLLSVHADPHKPLTSNAFHACVGTLLTPDFTPKGQPLANPLFRLLDRKTPLKMKRYTRDVAELLRSSLFPGVPVSALDVYPAIHTITPDDYRDGTCKRIARGLAADRIRAVGTYYKMGRVRGEWGLVPRGAEVGDRVFVFKDFGAPVLFREGGQVGDTEMSWYTLVGMCGVGRGIEEEMCLGEWDWEDVEIR